MFEFFYFVFMVSFMQLSVVFESRGSLPLHSAEYTNFCLNKIAQQSWLGFIPSLRSVLQEMRGVPTGENFAIFEAGLM